jgi:cyclopropane-fatty-acyl-phospholipid synthase
MDLQQTFNTKPQSPDKENFAPLLVPLFSDLSGFDGALAVKLWNGETMHVGHGAPEFTLVVHDPKVLRDLAVRRDPLRLAEAYFTGALDVDGSLYQALGLRHLRGWGRATWRQRLHTLALLLLASGRGVARARPVGAITRPRWLGTPVGAREKAGEREIAFHYDVSNEFYATWLDREMIYSCAYFERDEDSLDVAQTNKLDHICRKLRLKRGDTLLDVGCGWGALAIWAARHYGVRVKGITLSQKQFEYAERRVRAEGLTALVTIEKRDYRDLVGHDVFDKVSSVGMFEHVGLKNLPTYFETIHRVLKPGGLFLNHGITHDEEGWRPQLSTRFINRYVFPGGELDTVGNVQREMERAHFEVWDVEGLRPHYAKTLRHWVTRLERARAEALRYVDEATYRVWRLYMAACALHFEDGDVGIYQILASKRAKGVVPVPLTRRDLYNQPPTVEGVRS